MPEVVEPQHHPRRNRGPVVDWLLRDQVQPVGPESDEAHASKHPWWQVVALTGVDYFSTLSYLPGIAALAAGAVSPIATLLIVALTLLGMLPMYRRAAAGGPNRQGAAGLRGRGLPRLWGKLVVLALSAVVGAPWVIPLTP